MDMPPAEVDLDENVVSALIRAQHRDLADRPLKLVANGWDNAVYRLGDDLCVRLPRREVAVPLIRNEQRWLPTFAGRLNVSIPAPVRVGGPGEGYPWPWSITRWFEGTVAADLPPSQRGGLARALGEFMTRLHLPARPGAPQNPVRGVPLSHRDETVRERLGSGIIAESDALLRLWDELLETPEWTDAPCWVHGDPHPANLLVRQGELAAVLDFGDLTAGDPATDLASAWLVFDAEGREVFRRRVATDEHTWARARAWALNLGTAFLAFSDDNPAMYAIGRHAVDQVLLGDQM